MCFCSFFSNYYCCIIFNYSVKQCLKYILLTVFEISLSGRWGCFQLALIRSLIRISSFYLNSELLIQSIENSYCFQYYFACIILNNIEYYYTYVHPISEPTSMVFSSSYKCKILKNSISATTVNCNVEDIVCACLGRWEGIIGLISHPYKVYILKMI